MILTLRRPVCKLMFPSYNFEENRVLAKSGLGRLNGVSLKPGT